MCARYARARVELCRDQQRRSTSVPPRGSDRTRVGCDRPLEVDPSARSSRSAVVRIRFGGGACQRSLLTSAFRRGPIAVLQAIVRSANVVRSLEREHRVPSVATGFSGKAIRQVAESRLRRGECRVSPRAEHARVRQSTWFCAETRADSGECGLQPARRGRRSGSAGRDRQWCHVRSVAAGSRSDGSQRARLRLDQASGVYCA